MIDNYRVNDFVRRYLQTISADKFEMTDFYLLHECFDRLSEREQNSAILNIVFYEQLYKNNKDAKR